jgi:hypothetical protein
LTGINLGKMTDPIETDDGFIFITESSPETTVYYKKEFINNADIVKVKRCVLSNATSSHATSAVWYWPHISKFESCCDEALACKLDINLASHNMLLRYLAKIKDNIKIDETSIRPIKV